MATKYLFRVNPAYLHVRMQRVIENSELLGHDLGVNRDLASLCGGAGDSEYRLH